MAGGTADFFTSKHKKLFRISTLANFFAWVALIFYGFLTYTTIYEFFSLPQVQDYPNTIPVGVFSGYLELVVRLVTRILYAFYPGVVAWLVLKGISLGLKMIVETDINYREVRLEASSPSNDQEGAIDEQSEELVDEENVPVFYEPSDALNIKEWLERVGIIAIFVFILSNFARLSYYQAVVDRYIPNTPALEYLTWMIAIGIVALVTALQCLITYFSLRALASILAILMEMEYTSRGITR